MKSQGEREAARCKDGGHKSHGCACAAGAATRVGNSKRERRRKRKTADAQQPCVRARQALSLVPWWLAQGRVLERVCRHEWGDAGHRGYSAECAFPTVQQIPVAVVSFTRPEFIVAACWGVVCSLNAHFSVHHGIQTASAKTFHSLWCCSVVVRCALNPMKYRPAQQKAQHNRGDPVGLCAVCGSIERE